MKANTEPLTATTVPNVVNQTQDYAILPVFTSFFPQLNKSSFY